MPAPDDDAQELLDAGALVTTLPDAPVGQTPARVSAWFDAMAAAERPDNDGSLAAAHDLARLSQPRQSR